MVVGNSRKVIKLEIVDIHTEPFLDVLFDVVIYNSIRFSRTRSTQHNRGTKRIDHINPAIIPFAFVVKLSWQVNGILILHQLGFLLETLVFTIENIVHQIVAEQSAHPYPCHEQCYISHSRSKDVKDRK